MSPFSVCMSVYRKDNPVDLCTALNSVIIQSVPPSEIILIVDGPVSAELEDIIRKYESDYSIVHSIWLEKNGGLGNALKIAVEKLLMNILRVWIAMIFLCRTDLKNSWNVLKENRI